MQKFHHKNREYQLKIGWYDAMEVFPGKFGIHLTKLLGDMEKTNETLAALLLDDEVVVGIMWYLIQQQTDTLTYNDFLAKLTSSEVTEFREAFWEEVMVFSGPLKEPSLKEVMQTYRKELKNITFDGLDSGLPQEVSTPPSSPSES